MSLAISRPRCLRQRYRAKALRIQKRWPSVDVVQLERLQRRYPLFGASSGCTCGYTSASTSMSVRDPGLGTVRKNLTKKQKEKEPWCAVINVNWVMARVY